MSTVHMRVAPVLKPTWGCGRGGTLGDAFASRSQPDIKRIKTQKKMHVTEQQPMGDLDPETSNQRDLSRRQTMKTTASV